MKTKKVWLILGDKNGLGPAAIKYLQASGQSIVVLLTDKDLSGNEGLGQYENLYTVDAEGKESSVVTNHIHLLTDLLGKIDYVVNNYSYLLIDDVKSIFDGRRVRQGDHSTIVEKAIDENIRLLGLVLPFIQSDRQTKVINLPPRFCHSEYSDPGTACLLLKIRERFLAALYAELSKLNVELVKMEPGEPFRMD